MSRTRSGLGRIARLYAALEHVRFVELQRASLLVAEVKHAIALEGELQSELKSAGRTALEQGDQLDWLLAEGLSAFAHWRREGLDGLSRERYSLQHAATEQYRASHIECEQLHRLLENAELQTASVDGRKAQAAADDRFLSRRHWVDAHSPRSDAKSRQNK